MNLIIAFQPTNQHLHVYVLLPLQVLVAIPHDVLVCAPEITPVFLQHSRQRHVSLDQVDASACGHLVPNKLIQLLLELVSREPVEHQDLFDKLRVILAHEIHSGVETHLQKLVFALNLQLSGSVTASR